MIIGNREKCFVNKLLCFTDWGAALSRLASRVKFLIGIHVLKTLRQFLLSVSAAPTGRGAGRRLK